MANPLLEQHLLPPFSRIAPEHAEPAITQLISRNKAELQRLLDEQQHYTWDNLLAPLEAMEDELANAWSPVSHLNAVCNSDALRTAYNRCLAELSDYNTWLGQHQQLHDAYQSIRSSAAFDHLDAARRKAIDNALRDFRLAGVALPPAQKTRYAALRKRGSELSSTFAEHVLDATNAWKKAVTLDQLRGLPESALASARHAAQLAGETGYLITLELPSYLPVMTYCEDRSLREEVYTAYATRASDVPGSNSDWDNTAIIEETLDLRRELAQLLGFASYAQLSLATKMADSPDRVLGFLEQLGRHSLPQARRERDELRDFAREAGLEDLQAWDVAFYSEKLKQQRYAVSQEDIRPYLPASRALEGLFEVVNRLYGISVHEVTDFDSYHPDVQLFELREDGAAIARFYLDLYARADKRGGAWMDTCRTRRDSAHGIQLPVAYLVCNFTAPIDGKPSLLTHTELTTLFHEFGHGLHHMLTQQTVAPVSGINGVPWDAVELPSQFLENWCWEPDALAFITGHHETGEALPQALLDKLLAARNFQSAMTMMRQLEFALFDFRLHLNWGNPDAGSVQQILDDVRAEFAVLQPPPFNRFQNSFTHVFAGGYAAGYYSYKWAEVLSADAYSRFEEEGVFNSVAGAAFRHCVLERGGAQDPMELFVMFRGREPDTAALLRHSGIAA
ncbi:MAG: oligopeptidase A [Gammaproteobacteria bacterium]|nr:oligopeptidase A [Gammaproteobacteria bacterium]